MVRWSKTNFDCFFCVHLVSQRTRTGLRHSTYIYFSKLLHMVVHVCTPLYTHRSIEVNCCKRWGSDARQCPVARVAAMHSAFVHCALLQRCFVVKMHWSTVEEMHWCRVALGFTQSDAQRSAPPTVTLHWLFCKSAQRILRSIMHYALYILHTKDT